MTKNMRIRFSVVISLISLYHKPFSVFIILCYNRVISIPGSSDHHECAAYIFHELLNLSKKNILITPEFFVALERCFEILGASSAISLLSSEDYNTLFSEVIHWVNGDKWDLVKKAIGHALSTNARYLLLIPPIEAVYAFGIVALASSPEFFRELSAHAV